MSNLMTSISLAMNHFSVYAVIFTIPLIALQLGRRKLNVVRLGVNYAFLLYVLCVISLVFFPLPTMTNAMPQAGYGIQMQPFQFVSDIIRRTPFVWNQPRTYLPALLEWAVLQVVFNVIMMVPLGMYLRFNFHLKGRTVAIASFLFSCFIEFGQMTGLFFLFPQAYRLGDVDDLILNTLGGLIGCGVVCLVEKWFHISRKLEKFDIMTEGSTFFPCITLHNLLQ